MTLCDGKIETDIFQETDFSDGEASARLINNWVEEITHSKIKVSKLTTKFQNSHQNQTLKLDFMSIPPIQQQFDVITNNKTSSAKFSQTKQFVHSTLLCGDRASIDTLVFLGTHLHSLPQCGHLLY